MPQYVRHSGVWREVKEPYVRHSGAWRSVKEGYVRHAGVWRRFHNSAPTPGDPSSIGVPFGGGFYAGANIVINNQEYAIIVAPRASGGESSGILSWKTADTRTPSTSSQNDGWSNSNAMNNTNHPAARFCRTLNINGHSDWYLPSRDELEICYRYLKPTTVENHTSSGTNSGSNPPGAAYTANSPSQTSAANFVGGSGEDFPVWGTAFYWSSSEQWSNISLLQSFRTGQITTSSKTSRYRVRAVRRVAV